jgi:hypothetical protein
MDVDHDMQIDPPGIFENVDVIPSLDDTDS